MRNHMRRLVILLTVALASSACATGEQWAEWQQHSTHFASSDHLNFSLRHQGQSPAPRVNQRDVAVAKTESWWGDPIVVKPEQIFSN